MLRSREHVHCGGAGGAVTQGGEPLHVPAQGCRVTGDVHHPVRGHLRDGGDDLLAETLPGRVHRHHLGAEAIRFQPRRHVRRVAGEELGVLDPVPLCVLLGVPDGLGDELRADDPLRLRRHAEGDGPHAAVQIQYRLLSRQTGKLDGLAVQHLRLVPVHLIEGGHRQLERQSPEGVHQIVLPPEGAVAVP